MKVVSETVRPGSEFQFDSKPANMAAANFIAVTKDELLITRRASDLFALADDTTVIANWHGEWRTDAFLLTVAQLKEKAKAYESV
jgi:hypothetical protein